MNNTPIDPHASNNQKRPLNVHCPAQIRIGTRRSALAVAQAMEVKNRLLGAFPELTQEQIELVKIQTTGDKIQNKHLAEIGGKGLFTKEIEEMLHAGDIDIAVHSMKDMPDTLPEGMVINCILEREDPRDAFISLKAKTIMDLLEGAVIGTSSVRRQSQLLASRPDLNIVPFRGNVQTRLRKLEDGEVDATILAVAGLKRLDMTSKITSAVDTNVMLPAVAQGAIGVECLEKNHHILEVLDCINHTPSFTRVAAERSFLKMLDGSCTTPLGALATITKDGSLYFEGLLANPDGSIIYRVERKGIQADAIAIGEDAGQEVRTNAGHLLGCN